MGEALISRSGGGGSDEDSIVVIPGYHSLLVTLKTQDGTVMTNSVISCKDGSAYYNYTTNEKGQCLFMCNSGSANILVSNKLNGITYADIVPTWMNIDCPIGSKTIKNFVHNKQTTYEQLSSGMFYLSAKRNVNLILVGGGGGGAGAWCRTRRDYERQFAGGGGGAGYLNSYQITLEAGGYNFIAGSGGTGGSSINNYNNALQSAEFELTKGKTGGTSYIVNTSYSAAGGTGGIINWGSNGRAGVGGLGNGGYLSNNAGRSSVSFAGGGGGKPGGCSTWNSQYDHQAPSNAVGEEGGYPYGGSGSIAIRHSSGRGSTYGQWGATSGQRGGGGGACFGRADEPDENRAGSGGRGLLRIEFK